MMDFLSRITEKAENREEKKRKIRDDLRKKREAGSNPLKGLLLQATMIAAHADYCLQLWEMENEEGPVTSGYVYRYCVKLLPAKGKKFAPNYHRLVQFLIEKRGLDYLKVLEESEKPEGMK